MVIILYLALSLKANIMKKSLIVIVLIAVVALVTRPSFTNHQDKINDSFKSKNPVLGSVGTGRIVANMVDYHNYYIFSYTTSAVDGDLVSIGAFKLVIVTKDLDLD